MTAEFESLVELLLVILTITCILQVVFMALLLWYVKRVTESLGSARAAVLPPPPAPAAMAAPEPKAAAPAGPVSPAPAVPAPKAPAGVEGRSAPPAPAAAAPVAPSVDLFGGSPDIQGSILRLCEKHGLSDFIIATLDGLLVVSLSPGSSEEAARFSDLYRRKKKPDAPGVTFLEMGHRGEAMLGIARSDRPLTPDQLRGIGEDARKILNWWL
jgi:hypothetical protein